jgi:hypothetical protein
VVKLSQMQEGNKIRSELYAAIPTKKGERKEKGKGRGMKINAEQEALHG